MSHPYTPVEVHKDGKTRTAYTREGYVRYLWEGWSPGAPAPKPPAFSSDQQAELNAAYARTGLVDRKAAATLRPRRVMTTPPTVTLSAGNAASTITGAVFNTYASTKIRLSGGPTAEATAYPSYVINSLLGAAWAGLPLRIETETDAPEIEFKLRSVSNDANRGDYYRVKVNGEYVTAAPVAGPTATGQGHLLKIAFGSREFRRVEVETTMPFASFNHGPIDTLYQPASKVTRAMFVGDSFLTGKSTGAMATWGGNVAHHLGWDDPWINGVSGSGWTVTGGTAGNDWPTRLTGSGASVIPYAPDYIVFLGSINDQSNYATVQAAAQPVFQTIKTALPQTRVFVFGRQVANGSALGSESTNLNNAIRAAAEAVGYPFIDMCNPAGTVISGTGKVGAATGSGNADLFVQNDGLHLTQAGQDAYGVWMAKEIAARL